MDPHHFPPSCCFVVWLLDFTKEQMWRCFLQNKPSFYKTGPWYTLTFANSYTPNITRNTFNDYNHQSYNKGKTKNSSCFTFCMASSCQHQCFEKQNNLMRQTLTRFGEGILLKLQGTLEDRWDLFQMVDQSPGWKVVNTHKNPCI